MTLTLRPVTGNTCYYYNTSVNYAMQYTMSVLT